MVIVFGSVREEECPGDVAKKFGINGMRKENQTGL